jgi:alpha-glucosidase
MYRAALRLRAAHGLGVGELVWLDGYDNDVVALRNGSVTVVANLGAASVPLPSGDVVLASGPLDAGTLPADTTVWLVG